MLTVSSIQMAHLLSILNYTSISQLPSPQKTPVFAPQLSLPQASQQQSSHAQTSMVLWHFTRQSCNFMKHIWGTLCHLQALPSFSEIQRSSKHASAYLFTTLVAAKFQPSLQKSSQRCPVPKLPLTCLFPPTRPDLSQGPFLPHISLLTFSRSNFSWQTHPPPSSPHYVAFLQDYCKE